MRAKPLIVAVCLGLVGAAPALAARSTQARLPSAVAVATPGTGSALILSAGIAGGAPLAAMIEPRPVKRPRRTRLGSARPL